MSMQQQNEMTCQELVEVITDYIEGAMSAGDRQRFEAHLDECHYCANYLDQMRTVIGTLGAVDAESIPADARAELLEAFRGWKRDRSEPPV
jgi:anti-sigma factor RsiW